MNLIQVVCAVLVLVNEVCSVGLLGGIRIHGGGGMTNGGHGGGSMESGNYGSGMERFRSRPYSFSYVAPDTGSLHYRKEQGDANGNVQGSYGYKDGQGLYRMVDYVANTAGFKANIRSNEPGLDGKENPADVHLQYQQPPAGLSTGYGKGAGSSNVKGRQEIITKTGHQTNKEIPPSSKGGHGGDIRTGNPANNAGHNIKGGNGVGTTGIAPHGIGANDYKLRGEPGILVIPANILNIGEHGIIGIGTGSYGTRVNEHNNKGTTGTSPKPGFRNIASNNLNVRRGHAAGGNGVHSQGSGTIAHSMKGILGINPAILTTAQNIRGEHGLGGTGVHSYGIGSISQEQGKNFGFQSTAANAHDIYGTLSGNVKVGDMGSYKLPSLFSRIFGKSKNVL